MRSVSIMMATIYGAAIGTASALVEAGERTTIYVDAMHYDHRTSDDGGCDPNGCLPSHPTELNRSGTFYPQKCNPYRGMTLPDNTRDGSRAANSRWSCQGDHCCIMYYFAVTQDIVKMRMAFHLGDERTRTLDVYDIYEDGDNHTEITSSGTTLGYETFYLNTKETQEIELCLNGDDDEWLSITEVRFMVN